MRSKLICHGPRIFDTYELLEMLLYYTVPYKDTNPVAKRLLYAYGDLSGVFSQSREELERIDGIGDKSARFLKAVGSISELIDNEPFPYKESLFADYDNAAAFFVDYFRDVNEKKVTVIYLNNSMDVISIEDIADGIDYDSGAIKPKMFIDGAIRNRASVILMAHNHPFGSACPTPGDRATHKLICDALEGIRVTVAEHYVISGNVYSNIGRTYAASFFQSPLLESFMKKAEREYTRLVSEETMNRLRNCYDPEHLAFLSELLSYSAKNPGEQALRLLRRFHTVEAVLNATSDELIRYSSESTAVYIKLLAYVISRCGTDTFLNKGRCSKSDISEYLKSLYLGTSDETVYMMCFNSKDRYTATELVSVGTVNSSDVLPRKILEYAIRYSAKKIIIAHNHPGGLPVPSIEDVSFTAELKKLLRNSGIELLAHCIVAGRSCAEISSECVNYKII